MYFAANKKKPNVRKTRGFTLLEIIVSVGVFTVVATLAVGSLLILTDAEQKAFNLQTNQDNARFALESLAREIRTGIGYSTTDIAKCQGFTPCFTFNNPAAETVAIRLNGSTIEKWIDENDNGIIDGTEAFLPLTAPEVQVTSLAFTVRGNTSLDGLQPRVIISFTLRTPGTGVLSTEMRVQTSVSQYKLDS